MSKSNIGAAFGARPSKPKEKTIFRMGFTPNRPVFCLADVERAAVYCFGLPRAIATNGL